MPFNGPSAVCFRTLGLMNHKFEVLVIDREDVEPKRLETSSLNLQRDCSRVKINFQSD